MSLSHCIVETATANIPKGSPSFALPFQLPSIIDVKSWSTVEDTSRASIQSETIWQENADQKVIH